MDLTVALRVALKCSHHNSNNKSGNYVKDVLTHLIVVNILQYMHVPSYHIVHLKLSEWCMLIIYQ